MSSLETHGLVPTKVLDTYWHFAYERQEIFFKRYNGEPSPWTKDPILLQHKFTNCYRATDRVSQYLIKNVIYNTSKDASTPSKQSQSLQEIFFRTILFKIFNRIDTWEYLCEKLGTPAWYDFDLKLYTFLLAERKKEAPIYSAAYVMPQPSLGAGSKHENHLMLLASMMRDELPYRLLVDCPRMSDAYEKILAYPSMGPFLAYQYCIDINYGPYTTWSESEFVMPGPGALSGIKKCFSSIGDKTVAETIALLSDYQKEEFERLGLEFKTLFGRRLSWLDCQNLGCELDKYARMFHPEAVGIGDRHKIKQNFTPSKGKIKYVFPPKWRLQVPV